MIILAMDALDFDSVKRYNCKNLMQIGYGQTDISEFHLDSIYHIVLWASFLTGRNMELDRDWKTQFTWFGWWEFKVKPEETFLSFFNTYKAIDVPALTLKPARADTERKLLKKYYDGEASVEDFDAVVWKNHEENKKEFFDSLGRHDAVIAYFELADAIGHLSFGVYEKMEKVYQELEGIAKEVKSSFDDFILIVSDHGMKQTGRYGDHSRNGFYSTNQRIGFNLPKITDFYGLIKRIAKNEPI